MKKKAFTLVEVIIAITSFFLIITIIIQTYGKMMKTKYTIQAKTNIIQDAHTTIEKIQILLKDYTIDYEEYFNRTRVGCDNHTQPFQWNVGENGYCDLFTAYGNNNSIIPSSPTTHAHYFCSSKTSNEDIVLGNTAIQQWSWCLQTGQQSFGQYRRQFRDVKNDVDSVPGARNDDDDEHVMQWPSAIQDNNSIQELYMISQDGTSRIFIRRALLESWDRNNDGTTGNQENELLYTLQILKLKWFDAGNEHNFDLNNSTWIYDGKIDTRACDYAQGFVCQGSWIGTIYSGYKLPIDTNDGRVNLFQKNITISNWSILISPTKDARYAAIEEIAQINPYITLQFTSKLYGEIRHKRIGIESINDFQISLQTTFNTKSFYTK